jgi:hypothetical protein
MVTDRRFGLLLATPLQFRVDVCNRHLRCGKHIENSRTNIVLEGVCLFGGRRDNLADRHVRFQKRHRGTPNEDYEDGKRIATSLNAI